MRFNLKYALLLALLPTTGFPEDPSTQISTAAKQERKDDKAKGSWHSLIQKASEIAKLDNKPILLLFTGTEWSDRCAKLESSILSKPAFSEFAEKVVMLKIDFKVPPEYGEKKVPKELEDAFALARKFKLNVDQKSTDDIKSLPKMFLLSPTQEMLVEVDCNPHTIELGATKFVASLEDALKLANAKMKKSPVLASKSEASFTAKATAIDADDRQKVTIIMHINEGWHAYANPTGSDMLNSSATTLTVAGSKKLKEVTIEYPVGKAVSNQVAGNHFIYEGDIEITALVRREKGDVRPLKISVQYMTCNESRCNRPATVEFNVP